MCTAGETLTQQLGRTPSASEIAACLGVPEGDVLQARQANQAFSAFSSDAPLADDADAGALAELLGEDDPAVAHAIDIDAVHTHLDEFPEREQRILMLRFYSNLTQEQIA